jgi:type I restriction enzyme S subunit
LQCLKLDSVSKDAAVPGLDRDEAHNCVVPLCPSHEQEQIVSFISSESSEIARAIDKVVSEIKLIAEYRERLIADIVTGKLDVRQIKIPVPADEPTVDDAEDLEEELEAEDADVMEEAEGDE